jgi:hypothetical protein
MNRHGATAEVAQEKPPEGGCQKTDEWLFDEI